MVCNCSEGFTGDLCERLGESTRSPGTCVSKGVDGCSSKGMGKIPRGSVGGGQINVFSRGVGESFKEVSKRGMSVYTCKYSSKGVGEYFKGVSKHGMSVCVLPRGLVKCSKGVR